MMKLLDLIPEKELKEAVLSEYKKRMVLYKLTDEQTDTGSHLD